MATWPVAALPACAPLSPGCLPEQGLSRPAQPASPPRPPAHRSICPASGPNQCSRQLAYGISLIRKALIKARYRALPGRAWRESPPRALPLALASCYGLSHLISKEASPIYLRTPRPLPLYITGLNKPTLRPAWLCQSHSFSFLWTFFPTVSKTIRAHTHMYACT